MQVLVMVERDGVTSEVATGWAVNSDIRNSELDKLLVRPCEGASEKFMGNPFNSDVDDLCL